MKLVVVSTFWNSEKFIGDCINSIKNQYFTNFKCYMIDDMSTDNSYSIAEKTIDGDERFVLIKNKQKKYKAKNFIDIIYNNGDIEWDDVIIEIDGDDKLSDNNVFGLVNKIYTDQNIWICGTKWVDTNGRSMNYGKANPDKSRSTPWNFSHMRTYRAFLFRSINLKDLIFENEFIRAAVDIGIGIPMLEMAGNEHYKFIDEVTYIYNWHDNQSYSNNGAIKDSTLQSRTAKYIYSLPPYKKLKLVYDYDYDNDFRNNTDFEYKQTSLNLLNDILFKINDKPFNPNKNTIKDTVKYDLVNQIINNKSIYTPIEQNIKPVIQHKPKNREETLQLKKNSLSYQANKLKNVRPNRTNLTPNVFGDKKRV